MDSATTTAVPVETPEGADFAYAFAVFYCRASEHAAITARLVAEKDATVEQRFHSRTGAAMPSEVEWTENGIKCSLQVAPIFHRLYEEAKS